MKILNKKLLTHLTGIKNIKQIQIQHSCVRIWDKVGYLSGFSIDFNIHQLAYKCKLLALQRGYELESGILRRNSKGYCFASTYINCKRFDADTEFEAIFKAYAWILRQKE